MHTPHDFDEIARRYEKDSLVQSAASEILFNLLGIGPREDVLDLGCGTGHLSRRIGAMTSGRVLGIDPSPRMIDEARAAHGSARVQFEVGSGEALDVREEFDVVFCNSAFQWLRDPARSLRGCHAALRRGGRMGLQAPAGARYCPNFLAALEDVSRDPGAGPVLAGFKSPWLFLERADEYAALFKDAGFEVPFARIDSTTTSHAPEEVMRIFESGAAVGYLNPAHYSEAWPQGWTDEVRAILRASFARQVEADGRVALRFQRVSLVAHKC